MRRFIQWLFGGPQQVKIDAARDQAMSRRGPVV